MITEIDLINLGFQSIQIGENRIYCLNKFCLTYNATGWIPANIINGAPLSGNEVLHSMEDLKMYYLNITGNHLGN